MSDNPDQILNYLPISDALVSAGQPTAEQFVALKDAGVEVVVNLAMPDSPEALPDEGALVTALGMTYVHIPVVWEAPTLEALHQCFGVLETVRGKKVLVHCAMNMRASAFIYLYRVLRLGVAPETALETMHQIWEPNEIWQRFITMAEGRGIDQLQTNKAIQIDTPRLQLREYVSNDWEAIFAYQSDPKYLQYSPWTERTAEGVRALLEKFLDWQNAVPRIKYQFAVVLPEEGSQLIGSCGIRMAREEASEADIGYEIAPEYWGRGYATEAGQALLAFGFQTLELHRIWATCITENTASARVMEKLGMQREGLLRENTWMKSRWWDSLIYGILKPEWQKNQA